MSDLWTLELTTTQLCRLQREQPGAYRLLSLYGREELAPNGRSDGWPGGKHHITLTTARIPEIEAAMRALTEETRP